MFRHDLLEFVRVTGGSLTVRAPGLRFRNISTDTRTIRRGDLFVALTGATSDGHRFLMDAIRKGAAGAVVRQTPPGSGLRNFPFVVVPDTLGAYAAWARHVRRQFHGTVIAITGSNGKTTTKEMIRAALSADRRVSATRDNENNRIGVSHTICQADPHADVWVIEAGTNHCGEIAELSSMLRPDIAVVTGVSSAHIGNFGSFTKLAEEKLTLVRTRRPGAAAVVSRDTRMLLEREERDDPTLFAANPVRRRGGRWTAETPEGPVAFAERLPGNHNAENFGLALAVASWLGVPMGAVERGMATLSIPHGRMEISERGGVRFVNDGYNASRESYRALMREVAALRKPGGRVHAVCAGVRELGRFAPEHHKDIAASIAAAGIDRLALVGEEFEGIAPPLARTDRWEAVDAIPERWLAAIEPGDTVILKGSRHYRVERALDRAAALLSLRAVAMTGAA